ncbi:MAG TPA: 16S rRNA (cytosine(1402)-N(4))-methyltransferase RsmH [Solirubrobacterales bacterium]|nr:16S rRNA (cytosine(1402)-N(4))-methyltransferase RsmH [Solirubrobacterales bacterium]
MSATLIDMPADHVPVLAPDLIDLVAPSAGATVIDCTFGTGGHARLLAERVGAGGEVICIDRDPAAEGRFAGFAAEVNSSARFIRADFADGLEQLLAGSGSAPAPAGGPQGDIRPEAIVMDLGVSSPQIDTSERGFSYAYDAPLDMRMDPDQVLSADQVVNQWPESRLIAILREFGEERHARRIAREIVARRPIGSTAELVDAIREGTPPASRFGRGHPAKRAFQAIRIAVNGELDSLDAALPRAWELLAPGGRLAVIAFHSLEDRRVKRFFAGLAQGCECPPELPVCMCDGRPEAQILTRRPIMAEGEELEANPRARSARLRCAVKLTDSTYSGESPPDPTPANDPNRGGA